MEVLEARYNSAKQALTRLLESIDRLNSCKNTADKPFFRDSITQRFEFTYTISEK